MQSKKPHQKTVYIPDYTVFDLETTGLSTKNDAIIEIGAVKVRDHRIIEEFQILVDPGFHIPSRVSEINHITDEMVEGAPQIEEALKAFFGFAGEDILVGHNIMRFDLAFINRDCEEHFGKCCPNDFVDTVLLARGLFPGEQHSMDALSKKFDVINEEAHRAVSDAVANQKIYEILGSELENRKNELRLCPKCGNFLQKRSGRFGDFIGCTGYPDCRYTENIS